MAGTDAALITLRRQVDAADDGKVRRVVAEVDAMNDRSDADTLIAPLRPRLNRLRLAHPLRLPRVLFAPVEPLLVSAKEWRLGANTLPRSVIMPMSRIVEAGLGEKAAAIRQAIQDRTTDDIELICAVGASLWPDAASLLVAAEVPHRWAETGLSEKLFRALAAQLAALLRQAPALDMLVVDMANGLMPPDRHRIEAIVRAVTTECGDALPMLSMLLVTRLPRAAGVLYDLAARRSLLGLKAAIEDAASVMLDRLARGDTLIAYKGLSAFTASAHRMATLLAELDHEQASRGRREQIRELRQRLDGDCQAHFRTGL